MHFRVCFHFVHDKERQQKTVIKEDGSADYYHLNIIQNVIAQEVVASAEELADEEDLDELRKQEYISSLDEFSSYLGENVCINPENPCEIIATCNGHASYDGDAIHVSPVYETEGDISFSTGSLTFVGRLIVNGNIGNSFFAQGQDVQVYGTVDEAVVKSGGQLFIQGGIVGRQAAAESEGALSCKFIELGKIRGRENVYISLSALQSDIMAAESVLIRDPGILSGGSLQAGGSVYAKRVGANWSTPTEISLGLDPFLHRRLLKTRKMIQQLSHREGEILKMIDYLATHTKQASEQNVDALQKELKDVVASRLNFVSLLKKLERRVAESKEQHTGAALYVFDQVLPGTKITIFNEKMIVKETMEHVIFHYEEGRICTRECKQSMESLFR